MNRKQKKTQLEILSKKSSNAINLVLATIKGLKDTNDAIDAEKQKNEETIANIQMTNGSLNDLKSQNAKIIGNFEALLK
jgi:FtsZ-binding cell division protein ZapB